MDRRKFLAAMAAGAVVTAEGLWVPGQKLISIPSHATFTERDLEWAIEQLAKSILETRVNVAANFYNRAFNTP